ncbi:MAG: C40 family peptidase [Blautia faecis]
MKEEYEAQQSNLQYQLDVTRANNADCENEIAYAQQQATEYANLLEEQQAEIEQLEAERIAAEEEARRQAEAEAAAAAAAQEAEESGDSDSSEDAEYDEDGNAVSGSSDSSSDYEYDEYGNVIDTENTVDYDSSDDSSSSSSSSSSGSGSSVVDYATQFVGNPYVWGGTSLTSGADCSGFVQSVYANFGVSLPRTSYEQQNAGYEVSYADAQPGDLICYGGHVAIYMGNGQIVHASNSRDGIKISDNAAYRTITSVRRLV